MKKEEIIEVMRKWYMPNYFDLTMFDYTSLNDDEVYKIYLEELENYGDEITQQLKEHF